MLLWWLADSADMSLSARKLCADTEVRVLVSSISAFEIATKLKIGKFSTEDAGIAHMLLERYEEILRQAGFEDAPITGRIAARAGLLLWEHRDPFDRLLVAQAQELAVPLLTTDAEIQCYKAVQTLI